MAIAAVFSVGVVAGSSVLGMLIPPSLLLILFGLLAEQSIGDLFVAGIGPGLLLSLCFGFGIVLMAIFMPGFVGKNLNEEGGRLSSGELISKGLPVTILIVTVLGGIYAGVFTPVEAGAVGAIIALMIGFVKRRLNMALGCGVFCSGGYRACDRRRLFPDHRAQMYSRMLAFSGVPLAFGDMAAMAELDVLGLIALYVLIVIFLGMILDSASIMLILVPLMLPIVVPMGVDLVWFGIITVIAVEIGLLTPPFGDIRLCHQIHIRG